MILQYMVYKQTRVELYNILKYIVMLSSSQKVNYIVLKALARETGYEAQSKLSVQKLLFLVHVTYIGTN